MWFDKIERNAIWGKENLILSHNCSRLQIRREYGCYDEVFFSNYSLNKRQCNWIRFLRIVQTYNDQVNLIGTKVKGKIVSEHAAKQNETTVRIA